MLRASYKTPKEVIPVNAGIYTINHVQFKKWIPAKSLPE
jgi:hypothetical protein